MKIDNCHSIKNSLACTIMVLITTLFFLFAPATAHADSRKKVLILNSYHQIYFWTDGIMEGIKSVFDQEDLAIDFFVENMDTKRFIKDLNEKYYAEFRNFYLHKYASIKFDIIISSDDNALNFLLANRQDLFSGVPIVFCGINNYSDALLSGHSGITGVVESLDRKETLDIALQFHPETKQIAFVTDIATTGKNNRRQIEELSHEYASTVDFFFLDQDGSGLTYAELLDRAGNLSEDTIIYFSDFHIGRDGRFFMQRVVAEDLNKVSGRPVYVNYSSVFGKGTIGGKLNNPVFQGRTAAEKAIRILNGEPVSAIPIQKRSPNKFMFQYEQLKQYDLLKKRLPKGSIIVGKTPTFYEQYKNLVWLSAVIFFFQLLVIVLLIYNIRRRKKAEEVQRINQILLDKSQEIAQLGSWHHDINNNILSWSDESYRIYGRSPQEFEANYEAFLETIHPDDRDMVDKAYTHAITNNIPYECIHRIIRNDGEVRVVQEKSENFVDENGTTIYSYGFTQDITERKETEEELAAYRDHLEELVNKKTTELKVRVDEAEQLNKGMVNLLRDLQDNQEQLEATSKQLSGSNRELKEFAYIVSHDLRAPLRAISQLTHWISEDYAESFDADGKEQMGLILNRVKRMDGLIDGVLRYSRIGRVKEKTECLDLNLLVTEVIENLAPPDTIQITIENKLPVVLSDSTRMGQVFQNLIGNAVKFMDKDEGIIKVGCVDEGAFWRFSLADNGPGIDQRYHDKIFQIFQTLTARDERESTGIGLTLVKKIIELYGGSVWLESAKDHGTTFFFTLPKKGEKNEER